MPIANKLSPVTPEEHRTIDTDTGAYLELINVVLEDNEGYEPPTEGAEYPFVIRDGGTGIYFNSIKTLRQIDDQSVVAVKHYLHSFEFIGNPSRTNYAQLISNIMCVHGDEFGFTARTTDFEEDTKVEIAEADIQRLMNWEIGETVGGVN